MATRWSRRRLATTFVLLAIVAVFYFQQPNTGLPSWEGRPPPPMGGHGPPGPPGPPMPPFSLPPQPPPGPPQPPKGAGDAFPPPPPPPAMPPPPVPPADDGKFHWSKVELAYPIATESMRNVPTSSPETLKSIPKIQHEFTPETDMEKKIRLERLALVKANFTHAWNGYKKHAWMADEVLPIKGTPVSKFGGWGATLVDTLDSLWILGMKSDFEDAVKAAEQIDFTTTDVEEVNVFETTIRYLGGFLAAYDLSEGQYPSLLRKAIEVADMLYVAFDTPNHMPITRWKFQHARQGQRQKQSMSALVSEPGSLSLEFTRLSQLTGNPKYFDIVQRIMDLFADQQDNTYIPGLWPVMIDIENADFTGGSGFTIGGMADSLYEYLPKEYLLLGGALPQYRDMYLKSLDAMHKYIFFRPRTTSKSPMLFPGDISRHAKEDMSNVRIVPKAQHLGCFAGGMVGLGSRLFERPGDMDTARELVEGCLWAYENAPNGIMPEVFYTAMCPNTPEPCAWSEEEWHKGVATRFRFGEDATSDVPKTIATHYLTPGVVQYEDTRYILRPEAIESIFILYRLTGDTTLMDRAWGMFESIVNVTTTTIAHTALADCTRPDPRPSQSDSMESFWLAETLKYFYLLYEAPDLVSLDDYVLNTEAHPLKRPKA